MKILFLNLYSGINHRGAETFTHELANHLTKTHSLLFLQAGKKTAQQNFPLHQINSPVFQPQSLPNLAADTPRYLGYLHRFLKRLFLDLANLSVLLFTLKSLPVICRFEPQLIIPLNGFWQLLIIKILQPFLHHKIIVIGHSGPGWDERFNLYLKPDRFVAVTQPGLEWARQTCSWTKSILIPYALDPQPYQSPLRRSLRLPQPTILCPSALVPYKRLDLVIQAVAKIKNASLVIVGRGDLAANLTQLGRKLLGRRFLLTSVPHQQMPPLYRQATLVTLPSHPQENSPLIFLESLTAGKIIVTTDSPRNRWLLNHSGIFVNPQDQPAYTRALQSALQLAQKNSFAAEIAADLDKFSWSKVLPAYETAFSQLSHES